MPTDKYGKANSSAGTPGHCKTVSRSTSVGAPIRTDEGRDSPHMCETGALAGWEVEIPVKEIRRKLVKRETLLLTTLPHGLSKVMGETEYQEQVVGLQKMMDKQANAMARLKYMPFVVAILMVTLSIVPICIATVVFVAGWMSENAYAVCAMLGMGLVVLLFPFVAVYMVASRYKTGKNLKDLSAQVSQETSHWATRGIAWKLKTSRPLPRLRGGENPRVIAGYEPRVVVEVAPNAIELFQAHGPFPPSRSIPLGVVERYENYGSIGPADRGSVLLQSLVDDKVRFSLAYDDVFFGRIKHVNPHLPMMLKNVMSKGEFGEQVGVINREMDRLSKPWKLWYSLTLCSFVMMMPMILLSAAPLVLCATLDLGDIAVWLAIAAMIVMLLMPFVGIVVGIIASLRSQKNSEEMLSLILKEQTKRWEERGIEWYLSEDKYELVCHNRSTMHTDRRVMVAISDEAVDKFEMLGPFNPGTIDGAVCSVYRMEEL